MNRRRFLSTAGCAVIPLVSGCLNDPGVEGGLLQAFETDAPPNATITEASDERIEDVGPVQEGLRRAASGTSSVGEAEVTENEYDATAQALSDLPWYDRIEHNSGYSSGIYLRYEDAVYVVVLTPFCTDSWVKDARSDRGKYSWGGCIRRGEVDSRTA